MHLLDEIILKASQKGAKIASWEKSHNGKIIIHFHHRIPVFYLNTLSAADSLIHQYNLVSEYLYLYQHKVPFKRYSPELAQEDTEIFSIQEVIKSNAIQKLDKILNGMNNELSTTTKRKVFIAMGECHHTYHLTYGDFYTFRNLLLDYYQDKLPLSISSQNKIQLKMFIRFLEEMTFNDFQDAV